MPSHFTSLNRFTKMQGHFTTISVAPSSCPSGTIFRALLPAALRGRDVQRAAAALTGAALTENVVYAMKSQTPYRPGTGDIHHCNSRVRNLWNIVIVIRKKKNSNQALGMGGISSDQCFLPSLLTFLNMEGLCLTSLRWCKTLFSVSFLGRTC